MAESTPRELRRPVWYGREAESPVLPKGRFGIEFTISPATGPFGQTHALFGSIRLGPRHAEGYGTRAGAATEIVAIESETGEVYHQRAARIDAAPFEPLILTPQDLEKMDAVVDEVESNFNVDLCAHLGLPPEGGLYRCFCWMDDLVSGVRNVEVPADEQRPGKRPQPEKSPVGFLSMGPTADPFPQGPQTIPLQWRMEEGPGLTAQDRLRQGIRVHGRVHPDLLPAEIPVSDEVPLWLTVFVRSHLDRGFSWRTVPVPDECLEERSAGFTFHPFQILDPPERPQRHFVLVAFGSTLSEVLILEPGEPQKI